MFERNRLGNELQHNGNVATEPEYEHFSNDYETAFSTEWEENETCPDTETTDYEADFEYEISDYEALNPYNEAGGGRIQNKKDPASADMVKVQGFGKKVLLHKDAAHAWGEMMTAARADGLADPLLRPTSGYRSDTRQKALFEEAIKKYGSAAAARKWVAAPGGSAHRSGRAIDFYMGMRNDSVNVHAMRKTPMYAWLLKNAQRFGFYPYDAEPWHWEYNPPASGADQEYEAGRTDGGSERGCSNHINIVRAATAEWIAWNRGQLLETELAARPLLTKYWSQGAGRSLPRAAGTSPSEAWSAAFVSFIMKQGYPAFPSCSAHWQYVEWAKKAAGTHPFTAVRPQGAVIEVGDILVNARANSGVSFDRPRGKSHGDIVIAIDRANNLATVIGGNVGNARHPREGVTVNTKTRALTADGRLREPQKFTVVVKTHCYSTAPGTPFSTATATGTSTTTPAATAAPAGSPSIDAIMRLIPGTTEPRTVAALRPILDKIRGEIPLDYLAGWVSVESGGRNNVRTNLDERGYFQIHPDESKDYGYDHARISSDWKYSLAAGIDLVRRKARRAMAYANVFGYQANSDLYWRVAKLMHWLPLGVKAMAQAMKEDGFKPADWTEFRTYVATHRDRIREHIRNGNKARKVWDPMQGIENVEKLYRKANG